MSTYKIGIREFGTEGKESSVKVFGPDLAAGTFDANVALAAALRTAVLAVQLGEQREAVYGITENAGNSDLPTDSAAQRENKWLVSCREVSGGLNAVTFTIPCADLDQLDADGINMAAGANRTALVSAVEDFVKSNDGTAVVVESIKFRARSLG